MGWIIEKGKNISYWTIPEWLQQGVKIGFSTIQGGVSTGPYQSLNLALHVKDDPEKVLANRELFLAEFDCSPDDCVAAEQVHGTEVRIVTNSDKKKGMYTNTDAISGCDGLLTTETIGLMAFFADCVPLYFYCPDIKMVGLAHAGWRGTAANIASEMLKKIKEKGGSPEKCYVAIGPSIRSCCYQVGKDVAAIFAEKIGNPSVLIPGEQDEFYLDLAEANRYLLLAEGVLSRNIFCADLCTYCQAEYFFSYRREKNTGRMAAFIRNDCGQHGGSITDVQKSQKKA